MLHKKQNTKENMDRKTRRYCYVKLGKERFGFNKNEELLKYKYICGEKLSRREWKKCLSQNAPYSFKQWKELIENKYGKYSKEQLNEFIKYLEISTFSKSVSINGNNIFFSAMLSAFYSFIFTVVFQEIDEMELFRYCLVMMFVIIMALIPIYIVCNVIKSNELEKQMYNDYKNVIESLMNKDGK